MSDALPRPECLEGQNARQIAKVEVNAALLRHVLGLPDNMEIVGCMDGVFDGPGQLGTIVLKVEHPGLKWVIEGTQVPSVQPITRRNDMGYREFVRWQQ